MIKKLLQLSVSIVMPPTCFHCTNPLSCFDINNPLCAKCSKDIFYSSEHSCFYCGLITPPYLNEYKKHNKKCNANVTTCDFCYENKYYFDGIFCGAIYNEIFSSMVSALKFNSQTQNAKFFAYKIYQAIKNNLPSDVKIDIITCVPLSYLRLLFRGYNQSSMIAKFVYKYLKNDKDINNKNIIFIPDLIIKTKHTKAQSKLTRNERKTNLIDCFNINHKIINKLQKNHINFTSSNILIIDDVATTLSTLQECSKIVQSNPFFKPKSVFAASFARVDII